MAFLNKIKIPTKIFAGFGIVIVLLLLAAGIGSLSLADTNEDYDEYRALARQTALNQQGKDSESDDGLELGAVYIDAADEKLIFAGARFDLFIANGREIELLKGTKAGLGYRRFPFDQEFAETEIAAAAGRSFYLTTDGLIDQLGGEIRRAFGKRRLTALLSEMADAPFAERGRAIRAALEAYQGDNTRRDDVWVAGFKLG